MGGRCRIDKNKSGIKLLKKEDVTENTGHFYI